MSMYFCRPPQFMFQRITCSRQHCIIKADVRITKLGLGECRFLFDPNFNRSLQFRFLLGGASRTSSTPPGSGYMGHLTVSFTPMTVLASRIFTLVLFINVTVALIPKVDFSRMGKVALTGSFAGLDVFNNVTSVFDPSTSSLVSRAANGTLISLGSTDSGGSIIAACTLKNTLYVGGNFSSLSGTPFANVASYDTTSGEFAALGSGLDNSVHALYCDARTESVWAGGTFHAPVGADGSKYGGSVAIFDTNASAWSPPAFVGLSGQTPSVRSIVASPSGSSLYFGGSFITTYGSNTTHNVNGTNNPNVPFSSGATPFSSSLVPLPLTSADINANPSSTLSGFNNIANVLCPAGSDGPGNSWFSTDGTPTLITVRTNKYATARGVRLGNTFLQGRGTKTFK